MISRPKIGLVTALLAVAYCATASADASLYERIGGERLSSIANDLVDRSSSDPRTSRSWRKVSLGRVKAVLNTYLCSVTGGPCAYDGDTMKDVHAGLEINEAEMYTMVQSLRDIMIRHDVPLRERNELLALLAPTKREVVTR